jgi:IS30 family transposase
VSTISREMKRNCPKRRKYTPRSAHERALFKRTKRGREDRLKNEKIRIYVKDKLKNDWSPEQISGCIKKDINEKISHEAIYQYVYNQIHRNGHGVIRKDGEDLRMYLKRRHKRRTHKGMRNCRKVLRGKGISIDERPSSINSRKYIGHWEGDSIVSRKSKVGLNTLVERKTGYVCITRIKDGTAKETASAVIKRLSILPSKIRKTLTLDNGSENFCHDELQQTLGIICYRCHPYSSWERGTNENTNGLIRWYLPKGTDFATISDEEISRIEYELNTRPRKRLGYKTPLQMLSVALKD